MMLEDLERLKLPSWYGMAFAVYLSELFQFEV